MTDTPAPGSSGGDSTPAPSPAPTPAPAPGASGTPSPAPSPSPSPAPTPAPTLASGDPAPTPDPAPAPGSVDWRDQMAGGDAKFRERLNRFGAMPDFAKSFLSLEQKLSSGEYKRTAPPAGAKPEEVATWRKENGIPDAPEGYKVQLADGLVLGEADKPAVGLFAKYAHDNNWTNDQFNSTVNFYYTVQDAQASMRADADAAFKQTAEDKLRTEWGTDYRRKINAVGALRDGMPAGLYDRLLAGRTSDGTVIGNDPLVLSWLADLQATIDPAATLVPPGSGDTGKALNSRKAEIGKLIKDRSSDYYKGPNANALQAEYRQILDAESRMKGRAA